MGPRAMGPRRTRIQSRNRCQIKPSTRYDFLPSCRAVVQYANLIWRRFLSWGRAYAELNRTKNRGRLAVSRSVLPARATWAGSGPEGLRGRRCGRLCLRGRPYADTAGPESREDPRAVQAQWPTFGLRSNRRKPGSGGRTVPSRRGRFACLGGCSAGRYGPEVVGSVVGYDRQRPWAACWIRPGGAGPSLGGGASGPRGRLWGQGPPSAP